MRLRGSNRLFDDRRRLRSETIAAQIARVDELGRSHVGAMSQRAANRAAQIVDEHVVIAYLALGIEQDPVEDVDNGTNLDLEARFFEHFPREPGFERLAELETAARQAPLSRQRLP